MTDDTATPAPETQRSQCLTYKTATQFNAMYLHVEIDAEGRPTGGAISGPGKEPESQIHTLVQTLSLALDKALREAGAKGAAGRRMRRLWDAAARFEEVAEFLDTYLGSDSDLSQEAIEFRAARRELRAALDALGTPLRLGEAPGADEADPGPAPGTGG